MSDETLRAARRAALADTTERAAYLARYARVHAPADVLRERVRLGDLRADRVELAARLAHPVAREVHPHARLIDWTSWSERREVLLPLLESDRGLVVAWLADGAERALNTAERLLPVYENRRPGDSRPRRAIEAGRDLCAVLRRWVRGEAADGDVREARRAAVAVAYAAYSDSAADAAASAAAYAAYAAYAADATADDRDAYVVVAYAAYADAAADAAVAADDAYAAADDAAAAAADADAYAAGDDADDRGRWGEARDAEHAWRRDRLALHLLGEVEA